MTKGWYGQRQRHCLASKGVRSLSRDKRVEQIREARLMGRKDPESIFYDPNIIEEEFEASGMKKDKLKQELIDIWVEHQDWHKQKHDAFNELWDVENPPTEHRKRELYGFIELYHDHKQKFWKRVLDLKEMGIELPEEYRNNR